MSNYKTVIDLKKRYEKEVKKARLSGFVGHIISFIEYQKAEIKNGVDKKRRGIV